jgi:hypothetical protein
MSDERDDVDDTSTDWLKLIGGILLVFAIVSGLIAACTIHLSLAKDNGQFAASPLKSWFDKLASGKGLCCSFADGVAIEDVDWDTKDGSFRVRLSGQWVIVPDAAVVTEANRFGQAVVWPYQDQDGKVQIRCFIPGAGT